MVGAVEAWFGQGVAVALAERDESGRVGVCVRLFGTVAEGAAAMVGVPVVLVGKSVAGDPAWTTAEVVVRPVGAPTRDAVGALRRLVNEGLFTHDGGEELAEQVAALRITAGVDGPRVRSTGRVDAVKAAAWAAAEARVAVDVPAVF